MNEWMNFSADDTVKMEQQLHVCAFVCVSLSPTVGAVTEQNGLKSDSILAFVTKPVLLNSQ